MKKKDFITLLIIFPVTFITYSAGMYFLNYLTDGVGSVDLQKTGGVTAVISVIIFLMSKKEYKKKHYKE